MKRLLYISGPYTAPTHIEVLLNIDRAKAKILYLYKKGYIPVCPHTMSSFMGGGLCKDPVKDYRAWMEIDLAILERCDGIFMLKGWKKSKGAKEEHTLAIQLGLTIEYEK